VKPRIRTIALCVFRHQGRILVSHGYDSMKREAFLRPLGGGVEFGERASDALVREIREELAAEIDAPRLLGVLENVFTYDGAPGHEIVFVFDATFRDASLYAKAEVRFTEGEREKVATWQTPSALGESGPPLYPDGLRALLLAEGRD
jgi:ADP-ribose pyrophosphatase YjhB (NUDIX family)